VARGRAGTWATCADVNAGPGIRDRAVAELGERCGAGFFPRPPRLVVARGGGPPQVRPRPRGSPRRTRGGTGRRDRPGGPPAVACRHGHTIPPQRVRRHHVIPVISRGRLVQTITTWCKHSCGLTGSAARCPVCRSVSTSGKDWVLTRPHNLPCVGSSRWCSGASGGGAAPRSVRARRSPSRSLRCRTGCGPQPGCGPHSRWRWKTGGISPRPPRRTGCRGRRCSGRWWPGGGRVGRSGAGAGAGGGDGRDPVRAAAVGTSAMPPCS
jgi:hypothetical protein